MATSSNHTTWCTAQIVAFTWKGQKLTLNLPAHAYDFEQGGMGSWADQIWAAPFKTEKSHTCIRKYYYYTAQ